MSLTVTQRPNQFNSWVASGNPIVYKMTRKDYNITAIANSGGALQITVNANLATLSTALGGPVIAGSKLWVRDNNAVYNGLYTVVTCTNAANSVVTFTAGTYISAGAGVGYVNLISNRPIYRVETELYKASDNSLIFSKLIGSHNPQGDLLIDVGILNNYVDQEPLPSLSTLANNATGSKAKRNTTTSLGFYIKYRETWTNSAEAQTSDSANPAFVVKGARQVGDPYGGYLKEYSEPNATPTRKFLTRLTNPRLWIGRKNTLSFIDSEVSTTQITHIRKVRYNSDNSIWGATYDVTDTRDGVNKSVFEVFEDGGAIYKLNSYYQYGAGTAWTNVLSPTFLAPGVVLAAAASSQQLFFPLNLTLGKTYNINARFDVAGAGAETVKCRIQVVEIATGTIRYQIDSGNFGTGSILAAFNAVIPAVTDGQGINIIIIHNGGVNNRTITNLDVEVTGIPQDSRRIDYSIVHLTTPAGVITVTQVSETLQCIVEQAPDQPYQLLWKNILGGDANWVFGYSQDLTYRYQDGKRKRLILYADNLTQNEWEALNDLNTTGELYEPAFNELTSSINKTHARLGAQVYAIDSAGNKIGVVVIPTEIKTKTRKIGNSIQITIELPEIQTPR